MALVGSPTPGLEKTIQSLATLATTSMTTSLVTTAGGGIVYGVPVVVGTGHLLSADGTNDITLIENLDQNYWIIDAWVKVKTLRTGGVPDHDVFLLRDATTVLSQDIDTIGTANTGRIGGIQSNPLPLTKGSKLVSRLTVGGSTTTGTCQAWVLATLVPII